MSSTLHLPANADSAATWAALMPQLHALVEGEPNRMANLANLAAALHGAFGWHWVGFYAVDAKRDQLVLGPFQGPIACTRLHHGKGVCAAAWDRGATQHVPDVEQFPGHVACSAATRSEVVVPILSGGAVVAVLDVDSTELNGFEAADVAGLEEVAGWIGKHWRTWEG
jgi:L-methionine (R)-S-oxide reductase